MSLLSWSSQPINPSVIPWCLSEPSAPFVGFDFTVPYPFAISIRRLRLQEQKTFKRPSHCCSLCLLTMPPSYSIRYPKGYCGRFLSLQKSRTVTKVTPPHDIPSSPSSLDMSSSSSASSSCLFLEEKDDDGSTVVAVSLLPVDAQVGILSFLNEYDTRSVMQVNRQFRSLLQQGSQGGGGDYLWKRLALQRWPFLLLSEEEQEEEGRQDRLPAFGPSSAASASDIGMDVLLGLAASSMPSSRDLALARECSTVENIRNDGRRRQRTTAVVFTGRVGQGDRCVRSVHVLPKPRLGKKPQATITRKRRNLWQRWRRNRRKKQDDDDDDDEEAMFIAWRPFVLPFCLPNGGFSLTPRCISYFEVNIIDPANVSAPPASLGEQQYLQRQQQRQLPWSNNHNPYNNSNRVPRECVAVGISLDRFSWQRRMPGWDGKSCVCGMVDVDDTPHGMGSQFLSCVCVCFSSCRVILWIPRRRWFHLPQSRLWQTVWASIRGE